jgi:AraC family transcriptional regulator of adaptative response/methylated-DNA-[protein]-cysteine methyltransferase
MDTKDYIRVESALAFLSDNRQTQPSLADVAAHVGLSEHHLQRLFTRWAGISPKRFLQFQTIESAKSLLRDSRSVLDATYSAGLSSGGRLHDLFVTLEAVTPGEFKSGGAGLTIRTGFHDSPFGECLIGVTDRGICGLSFVVDGDRAGAMAELEGHWPGAEFVEDARATRLTVQKVFAAWNGGQPLPTAAEGATDAAPTPLSLLVRGTNFQVRVWQALLRIPPGAVATYEDVASVVGRAGATRAVGSAIARNPVAYLIPCHRVIRKTGAFGGYHWGAARKVALLLRETASPSDDEAVTAASLATAAIREPSRSPAGSHPTGAAGRSPLRRLTSSPYRPGPEQARAIKQRTPDSRLVEHFASRLDARLARSARSSRPPTDTVQRTRVGAYRP